MNKISFCTVCMNRLMHLSQTLPANIQENIGYPELEFVVLDYNSKDNMEDWVRTNLPEYIESGILKYYKTLEPDYIYLSHSKNMSLRLATGDITCLLDADNYAGKGFAEFVNTTFENTGKNTVLTTIEPDRLSSQGDTGGKISFHRDLLYSVNGFDESLVGYGIDDIDLVNRLEKAGGERVVFRNDEYLRFISHSNEARLKNHAMLNKLNSLYLLITGSMNKTCRALFLSKDQSFIDVVFDFEAGIKNNIALSHSGWVISKDSHKIGKYEKHEGELKLTFEDGLTAELTEAANEMLSSSANGARKLWKKIHPTEKLYLTLIKAYGECVNRMKYLENDTKEIGAINPSGWGAGTVYKNFDYQNAIRIS